MTDTVDGGTLRQQWQWSPENGFTTHWRVGDQWVDYRIGPAPDPVPATEAPNPRAAVLDEAKSLICGARNNTYGPPTQDFERTAAIWTAVFGPKLAEGVSFSAADVAKALIALKLSRLTWAEDHRDNWVDIAGYAGCGYECVEAGA